MKRFQVTIETVDFSRKEIKDIFDEALLSAGNLYGDIPYLLENLQWLYHRTIEECDLPEFDPTRILEGAIFTERISLDLFNKDRLGRSVTRFNRVVDPNEEVEYKEEENIPEQLEFFPLRSIVVNRGVDVITGPIFQLEGTVAGNQAGSGRAPVPPKKPGQPAVATGRKTTKQQPTNTGETGSSASYNKLRGAPSAWLALPDGNLTLAEVMAFVPQSIKSVDAINRFLFNGAMTTTLTEMINNYRVMQYGAITNNSVYRMMKGQINHHAQTNPGYQNWTVARHSQLPRPEGFDSASVSVAGFATPVILSGREARQVASEPTPTILFRDLADGVEAMPTGYDALDLTRCVQYCVEHDDEQWYYPQDFADLVEHLGGPALVHRQHQDAASITRHTEGKKLVNARRAGGRARDNHGRLIKGKGPAVVDVDESNSGTKEDKAGSSLRHSQRNKRKRGAAVPPPDGNDTEDDNLGKPVPKKTKRTHVKGKKVEKPDQPLRRSNREKTKRNYVEVEDEEPEAHSGGSTRKKAKLTQDEDSSSDFVGKADTSKKGTSQRKTKPLPKSRVPRVKPAPPNGDDGLDSEDSDVYVGPKRQKRVSVVRTSGRERRFQGSYNVDKALKIVDEEEL